MERKSQLPSSKIVVNNKKAVITMGLTTTYQQFSQDNLEKINNQIVFFIVQTIYNETFSRGNCSV